MPVYTCPECDTDVRTKGEVPSGKRLRCPECDFAWAPTAGKKKAAAPPPPKPQSNLGPDGEPVSYGVAEEAVENEEAAEARKRTVFTPLKDRFKKNMRGPALAKVTAPATWLLMCGSLCCAAAIAGILISIWPMVFIPVVVQPTEKKLGRLAGPEDGDKRILKPLTPEERREAWVYVGCNIGLFLWGSVICWGASSMHSIESYALSMVGSLMGALSPGTVFAIGYIVENIKDLDAYYTAIAGAFLILPGLPVAGWCVRMLNLDVVKEGFAEEKPVDA